LDCLEAATVFSRGFDRSRIRYYDAPELPLKVVYANPTGFLGGAERALLDLVGAVRHTHPNWTLELVVGSYGDLVAAARGLGIDTVVLPLPAAARRLGDAGSGGPAGDAVSRFDLLSRLAASTPPLVAYLVKLRALLCERQPDLVHSNGFKTHILVPWAAPRTCKVLWHVHDYLGSRPFASRLIRAHAHRCDVAVANSHSVARDLDSVCLHKLKISTVHNAVDLQCFSPSGPALDLDALSGLPPAPLGSLRVGLVATMARWKGHEVFLRALSMLASRFPIRGYVVGGPIYETAGSQYSLDELRSVAQRLGLNGNLGFTGFITDSAAGIRALDVVVHASTQPEPFGLVVAEAMACGKPVVAAKSGGVTEIISDDETVLSYRPGDAAAMAACIERLIADQNLRKQLGTQARGRAKELFDQTRFAREMLQVYQRCVQTA
jgi:glycosyltransferase involved in cell wall biosynthesis